LSHQLKRMEQRGLIAREKCGTDSRGRLVRLTAKGREAIEAAAPGHAAAVRRYLFDALTPAEVESLESIAAKALGRLAADPGGQEPSCGIHPNP
jgi:DNA-binding MarR family transcriptional regulator